MVRRQSLPPHVKFARAVFNKVFSTWRADGIVSGYTPSKHTLELIEKDKFFKPCADLGVLDAYTWQLDEFEKLAEKAEVLRDVEYVLRDLPYAWRITTLLSATMITALAMADVLSQRYSLEVKAYGKTCTIPITSMYSLTVSCVEKCRTIDRLVDTWYRSLRREWFEEYRYYYGREPPIPSSARTRLRKMIVLYGLVSGLYHTYDHYVMPTIEFELLKCLRRVITENETRSEREWIRHVAELIASLNKCRIKLFEKLWSGVEVDLKTIREIVEDCLTSGVIVEFSRVLGTESDRVREHLVAALTLVEVPLYRAGIEYVKQYVDEY